MRKYLYTLLLGLAACGSPDAASDTPADPCQAAADHLAACAGGDPAPVVDACDPEQAQAILDADCNLLTNGLDDAKSDGFGFRAWGCRAGLYRYCTEPMCEPAVDEAEFEPLAGPEGSACLQDALNYQGCGACAYYACREADAQCGDDAYLIRFAEKYCLRFRMVSEPEASPEAKEFLRKIRRCLITTLDELVPENDDCEAFETTGFNSHPECYIEAGFCDLGVSDWLLVLNTIDTTDNNFRQMLITGIGCLGEWTGLR